MKRHFSVSGLATVLPLCLCVAASVSASACKNQAPPVPEAPAPAATVPAPSAAVPAAASPGSPAAAESAAPAPAAAADHYSETAFDLVLQPKGSYESGQPGEAEIVLSAKPPFHVNDKYPYKFKIKEAAGLKFASLLVAKDLVKLEPLRATLPVRFTPENAGPQTVEGQLSFSVCTEDKCMIEKRDLALAVEAK